MTHGWAEIDVEAYGALHLTPAARPVLRGEVPAMLRQQLAVTTSKDKEQTRRQKAKIGKDGKVEADLTADDEALYEKLKAQRLDTAREENVPAFVILHDSVLREIARSRPRDKQRWPQSAGLGKAKVGAVWEAVVGSSRGRAERLRFRGMRWCFV